MVGYKRKKNTAENGIKNFSGDGGWTGNAK
jgi:hypothetical protein